MTRYLLALSISVLMVSACSKSKTSDDNFQMSLQSSDAFKASAVGMWTAKDLANFSVVNQPSCTNLAVTVNATSLQVTTITYPGGLGCAAHDNIAPITTNPTYTYDIRSMSAKNEAEVLITAAQGVVDALNAADLKLKLVDNNTLQIEVVSANYNMAGSVANLATAAKKTFTLKRQ